MFNLINQQVEKLSSHVHYFEENKKANTAIAYMLVSGLFFVCSGSFIKQIKDVQPMFIFCLRSVISISINSIVISFKGYTKAYFDDKEVFNLIMKRVFFGFIADFFYVAMFKYLTIGDAVSLVLTYPIISSIMAGIILQEKVTQNIVFSLILCLIGIIFVCKPPFILHLFIKTYTESQSTDMTMGLLTGMGFSIFLSLSVITTRKLSGKITIQVLLQYLYVCAISLSTLFIITDGDNIASYIDQHTILMLLGTGTFHYLAQILYNKSLFLEKATKILPFSYTQVIFSFIADVFVFGYDISGYSMFGCLLIVAGSYLTIQS